MTIHGVGVDLVRASVGRSEIERHAERLHAIDLD